MGLASDSFTVAVVGRGADMSVLWGLLCSGFSASRVDLGPFFPVAVLLCIGRGAMFGPPVLSNNWLRDVGATLRAGEASVSCGGAVCVGCLSTGPVCSSKSGLGCWGVGKRGLAILGADNSLKGCGWG